MSQKTLLIVDDIPTFLDEISHLCRDLPCKIMVSSSGREALKIIESHQIDLVVSDVMMADGNGLWLLEQLVAKRIKPSTFCFHSADATIKRSDVIKLGADEFFQKIFEITKLKNWLRMRLAENV